jgi:hypothetical protein
VREWVGDGLMIAGALVSVGGAIRAYYAGFRFARAIHGVHAHKQSRDIATLAFVYSTLLASLVTEGGLVVLIVGAVIGFGVAVWAPAVPIGLALVTLVTREIARRRLAQLRRSA